MHGQPERDQEAEQRSATTSQAGMRQAAAPLELVHRERDVAEQRAEQQQRAGRAAPHRDERPRARAPSPRAKDAERMVDQMARGEGHQHEAGGQAQPGGEIGARAHRAPSSTRRSGARGAEQRGARGAAPPRARVRCRRAPRARRS